MMLEIYTMDTAFLLVPVLQEESTVPDEGSKKKLS